MNERPVGLPSVTVRHEPVQARAAQRIEALLDAAAAVVVEHGIEHLTTALVAERAGASIGTVYRYFPDRVAVLVALAERNFERMHHAIDRVLALPHATWRDATAAVMDTMVDVFRHEPSFRSLRGGEGLDLGPERKDPVAPQFVALMLAYVRERWGFELDDDARERLLLAVGTLDAMVTYAFLHDDDGEPRYLEAGRTCAQEHLEAAFAGMVEARDAEGEPVT